MSDVAGSAGRDPEAEEQMAKALFNRVWMLLEQPDRTADDDAAMLHAAHASCHHWLQVGGPERVVRGEWQCSRVYATLKRAEPALFHAQRCLDLCQRNGIGDFDLAFAFEAIARAHAVAGDRAECDRNLALARAAAEGIAETDDKEIALADLATIDLG